MAKLIEPPADTPFNRHMAEGHKNRTGHALDAVLVSDDGELWQIVRLCCGETVGTVELEDPEEDHQIGAIAEYMVPYFPADADGVDIRDYAIQAYDAGVRVKL